MWRTRRIAVALALTLTTAGAAVVMTSTAAVAADLSVSQALAAQDGRSASVVGYVVGQPTATSTVLRSGFTGDTALALADSASETGTTRMLYVQITASYRASFGLQSNPSLMGRRLVVAGQLTAYFSHGGLKSPTSMSLAGTTPTTTPTGGPTPTGPVETYYAAAAGKTGTALRTALHTIIKVQSKITYDQVWDALKDTDQDPNNSSNVILLYSGRSQSKTTNGGGANDWNREHVWAKSHGDFGTATGPGTDVHHLRPEDVSVNAARGNKDFDLGGSAVSEAPGCLTDSDSFEPRAAVKGDVARMIMYMAIRYEGDDGWADLEINNSVGNGSAPRIGKLSVLLQWHQQDPPDAFEKRRNERIYAAWQHNRNPFIDHPEWAAAIWGS
ncbi:endonuclease [Dactylosporangium sp. NBC_01737]|uniref:endonuclease n=1 Tax=Dactylosporangium sp. NBC_01737 TaxID=2975959 RepID=UPI002E15535C|nr:endonuclease [Dactylosporangium sp. NBC_01737]